MTKINGGFNRHRPSGWTTVISTKVKGDRTYINYAEYDGKGKQRYWAGAGYIGPDGEYVGPKSAEKFLRQHGII